MYVNLAAAAKLDRAMQIVNQIGAGAFLQLYSGVTPLSPDLPPNGSLLASLPLASELGTATLSVERGAIIDDGGFTGNNGGYPLRITGDGVGATGFFVVSNQRLTDITIVDGGYGYTEPATLAGFEAGGLSGAQAVAVMSARIILPTILSTTAIDEGIVGWARVVKADLTTGVLDLDVGLTNDTAVVMDNIALRTGATITCNPPFLIDDGPAAEYGTPARNSTGAPIQGQAGQRRARIAAHLPRPASKVRLTVT